MSDNNVKDKPQITDLGDSMFWRIYHSEQKFHEEIRKLCIGMVAASKKQPLTRRENIMRLRDRK